MKLGAERKKVAFLVVLTGAAAYLLYSNVFSSAPGSGSGGSPRASAPRPANPDARLQAVTPAPTTPAASGRTAASRRTSQEFRPAYKRKTAVDASSIDPKLRLDLLAKVQAVELGPAERNLFQFGAATASALPREPGRIIPKTPAQIRAEQATAAAAAVPPGPPPPPPIPLKYYGYTAQRVDGHKRAFFLDGDDIFVAAEGDVVKRRYKVVRIGVSSAVVEDTQFNNTQTLPLAEESAG
jgi:hypothetical protein